MRSRFAPLTPPGALQGPGRGRGGAPGRGDTAPPAGTTAAGAGRGPGRGPDPFPNQPVIQIETGDFDPVIGRSYREISVISRNEHRSQGQGAPLAYGAAENLLSLVEGDMPHKNVFDGIDTSWKRVPGGGVPGDYWRKRSVNLTICIPRRRLPRCWKRARWSPTWRSTKSEPDQLGAVEAGRNRRSDRAVRRAADRGAGGWFRLCAGRHGENFADRAEPVPAADHAGGYPPERLGGCWTPM